MLHACIPMVLHYTICVICAKNTLKHRGRSSKNSRGLHCESAAPMDSHLELHPNLQGDQSAVNTYAPASTTLHRDKYAAITKMRQVLFGNCSRICFALACTSGWSPNFTIVFHGKTTWSDLTTMDRLSCSTVCEAGNKRYVCFGRRWTYFY